MELFSNFFQIAVTLLGFCMSGIRYLKDRKQAYFLLTCFYSKHSFTGKILRNTRVLYCNLISCQCTKECL